jgi:heme-degrading monooxygenase HmoA
VHRFACSVSRLARIALVGVAAWVLVAGAPALAQAVPAPIAAGAEGDVTVLLEVRVASDSEDAQALAALNDLRGLVRRQPGYVSETLFKNLNGQNEPRYVHVSRWVSMAYWAAVFRAPEFARLNAHANEHFSVTVTALLSVP